MASQPSGGQRQHQEQYVHGTARRGEREGSSVDRASRRPVLAADDADAADILQAWDRARAAEDANVQRGTLTDSGIGIDGVNATAGSVHDEDIAGHSSRKHQLPAASEDLTGALLTGGRYHGPSQVSRMHITSIDGRKGFPAIDPSSSDAFPRDRVRKAKQRRNSYSVPQSQGLPDLILTPAAISVSQKGAPPPQVANAPLSSRRPPIRRATLQDLQIDVSQIVGQGAQPSASWGGQPPSKVSPTGNHVPGSPSANGGREVQPSVSSSGLLPNPTTSGDGVTSGEGNGIRQKIIKMISIQRTKQRATGALSKMGAQAMGQAEGAVDGHTSPPAAAAEESEEDEEEPAAPAAPAAPPPPAPLVVPHDSDEEDEEDVRGSGTHATAPWNMGSASGPSPSELRMMGATTSVSFKKNTLKQGVLRPLSTLPPFVPRLFIEDITLNHDKYRGFDAAGRDLNAASKTLQPSIIELQAAVMIADVTGFTKLTEILSKKGTSGVELLTTCMNNYFTRAINMIMAFEGDVIKFAGDSMIVLFYPNEYERRQADKGLRACTLRMVACSHQLATKLGHMRMKMNGQVEPAPPPTPEPEPPPLPPQSALLTAPLPSTGLSQAAAPSGELEQMESGGPSAGPPDVVRNNSGPFSSSRRVGRDSPRSSATNQQVAAVGGGDEASSSAADAAIRGPDGSETNQQTSVPRKRGKSWSLMANILKVNRGLPRRSDVNITPAGSSSPAGASSSGPSRGSFDKADAKASRMSARERAKTETGLGLTVRGVGGIGSGSAAADSGGSGGTPAGLWAGGEGVVRREMSVATKLNLPPPLRPMQSRSSVNVSPLNVASGTGSSAASGPLASGVYPGSGGALASLGGTALSPGSGGSPRSFTEQAAASGGSFRRAPLGARSERRMAGGPMLAGGGGATQGDWRSKLQNLSTAIVQAPGGMARSDEDPLTLQRSRLSESARAVRWDTVQEEDPASEEESGGDESEHEEDASYPPIQSDGGLARSSSSVAHGSSHANGGGRTDLSAPIPSAGTPNSATPVVASGGADRVYTPVGSQSAGVPRSAHFVDLRRKLLLRASQSDREDLQRRGSGGTQQREEGLGNGPGPVAEGLEDGPPGRSRGNSDTEGQGLAGGEGKQGSFMQKVVGWFSANSRNRGGSYIDSFSNLGPQQAGAGAMQGQEAASSVQGSQPPSGPVSASNSFNYASGLATGISRVPPPNMGGGNGPMGKGPRGDPIMEEVSNSRLSLKVMTSAGSVCVFHCGGGVDEVTDPNLPEVPRWEFFIGDRPLAPLLDANQRRRCISQVAAIEDQAMAGSVVAGIEVVELIQGEWEVLPLPDSVWRVVGPAQPAPQAPIRLSHTSVRTSATSHTPHWRSSDVAGGMGSSVLTPGTDVVAQAAEAPQATEALEDLAALQALRMTSSATNGHAGAASSAGQPSCGLAPLNRSLGNSLNSSSDRPTYGSINERVRTGLFTGLAPMASGLAPSSQQLQPQAMQQQLSGGAGPQPGGSRDQQPAAAGGPQSVLATATTLSSSARFDGDGGAAGGMMAQQDSMERGNSVPASAATPAGMYSQSISNANSHHTLQPVGSHGSNIGAGASAVSAPAGGLAAAASSLAAAAAAAAALPPRLRHEFVNQPEHVQRRIAGLLRMHVLGSVRIRVEAGHLDFINEIRPLTVMFLGFPSLLQPRDDVSHKDQVSCVQFAYTSVQGVMRKWDGSFLQFRSDEKGFVGICAFGLPGHTHEDNPARGIRAALELASTIKAGGHRVSIGVTTGDLLCTCVGARKLRSEYTVFGDAINLSARLMVKCKKDPSVGEILCDEPTYLRAKYQAAFLELEPLPVKGKAQPVLVYTVGAHDATAEAQAAQQRREAAEVSSGERPLIGRDAEMTFTLNQAATMISGETHGGIIIIEGNTGMGKTKLLMEIRKSLERINADTSVGSRPAFHMVFGMADTANKSQKLHPWRRVFQELFALDLKLRNLNTLSCSSVNVSVAGGQRRTGSNAAGGAACAAGLPGQCSASGLGQGRRRGTEDGPGHAVFTALGERLSRVPNYDTEWRQHLAELLDLPLPSIPLGSLEAEQAQHAQHTLAQQQQQSQAAGGAGGEQAEGDPQGATTPPQERERERDMSGGGAVVLRPSHSLVGAEPPPLPTAPSMPALASTMTRSPAPWKAASMRHSSMTLPGPPPVILDAHSHASSINMGATAAAAAAAASVAGAGVGATVGVGVGGAAASEAPAPSHGPPHSSQVGAAIRKNSLNFLVHVMQEFIQLYGPTLALLENLHDFDTWSWQLLVKAAEVLTTDCMILATTRPNDLPAVGPSHHLHGKAALYQKVAMMYRHLLKLPSATRIVLEPFNFAQTKSLMQVVSDVNYPEQYVLAVMEKTGGMPLYIEKVTEFLCQSQRPWLPDQGGEFSANVNKMIRNLNFQQVIIERMDRLKPGIHLSLKVASVMGQWVDLDILHKFYPINKSKDELRAHLQELERGNFLKPTDAEGVWEFNMVERDIVYEVIPHYQRRRLHAKLAQELEKSLEEQHVATLTTIAYHWNQACMGHEVAEVECSLKAIEFWHRAAEAAYTGSSLMEALKLYQKAAQIAEVLAESMGGSVTARTHHHPLAKSHDRHADDGPYSGPSASGREGASSLDGRIDATDQSFTAVGSAFRGQLNWALTSRLSRSQWEKSMASCCLGIVLQHRYEFNRQLEYWATEDYFRLLTEHAIRGLMLLGAPHPKELLSERKRRGGAYWLGRVVRCGYWCRADSRGGGAGGSGKRGSSGGGDGGTAGGPQPGWHSGLVLQDSEVRELRDILLVLIIAAEHYSSQHDGVEYTRLLMFCKRVCKFFNKCSDSGTDPFLDIRSACSSRIKHYKASRATQSTYEFGVSKEPALEAAAARNATVGPMVGPELSRAVLGWQRQGTNSRGGYG